MTKQFVSNRDESVRMFRSDLLEKFTHVHPVVPHLIYWPVVGYMLFLSIQGGIGFGLTGLLFLAGPLLWSLTEYLMHRWVFHVADEVMEETTAIVSSLKPGEAVLPALKGWQHKRYFIAHGVHHDFPSDSERLVMAPAVSVSLAVLFYYVFKLMLGAAYVPAIYAGFVVGYLVYDTTHYAVHHFRMSSKLGQYLKQHHFRHHFRDPDSNYGVSSPLWDVFFGTFQGRRAVDPSEQT